MAALLSCLQLFQTRRCNHEFPGHTPSTQTQRVMLPAPGNQRRTTNEATPGSSPRDVRGFLPPPPPHYNSSLIFVQQSASQTKILHLTFDTNVF